VRKLPKGYYKFLTKKEKYNTFLAWAWWNRPKEIGKKRNWGRKDDPMVFPPEDATTNTLLMLYTTRDIEE